MEQIIKKVGNAKQSLHSIVCQVLPKHLWVSDHWELFHIDDEKCYHVQQTITQDIKAPIGEIRLLDCKLKKGNVVLNDVLSVRLFSSFLHASSKLHLTFSDFLKSLGEDNSTYKELVILQLGINPWKETY